MDKRNDASIACYLTAERGMILAGIHFAMQHYIKSFIERSSFPILAAHNIRAMSTGSSKSIPLIVVNTGITPVNVRFWLPARSAFRLSNDGTIAILPGLDARQRVKFILSEAKICHDQTRIHGALGGYPCHCLPGGAAPCTGPRGNRPWNCRGREPIRLLIHAHQRRHLHGQIQRHLR
jgi:hypothetical protein